MKKPVVNDKEKQLVQDEEVFLYKPYNISPQKQKTLELKFIQDEVDNLDKYMKYL